MSFQYSSQLRHEEGAYMISVHENLLRDIEFEQLCIQVIDEAWNDVVENGCIHDIIITGEVSRTPGYISFIFRWRLYFHVLSEDQKVWRRLRGLSSGPLFPLIQCYALYWQIARIGICGEVG